MAGLISLLIGIVQFLVGFRFIFLLVGANPSNAFVNWIYDLSGPLVAPFASIIGKSSTAVAPGAVVDSVFEWSSLIALIIYGIIGAIVLRLTMSATRRPHYQ